MRHFYENRSGMLHSKRRYHQIIDVIFMLLSPRIWTRRVAINFLGIIISHRLDDNQDELKLKRNKSTLYNVVVLKIFNTFSLPLARAIALLVSLLFSYLTVTPAFGQEPVGLGDVRPLKIGDTIPEELWDLPLQVVNHPDGKEVTRLSDYRDKKLIILDFWATWCGTCLENIIKINDLESTYNSVISFLKVNSLSTKDTPEKIEKTFNSLKIKTNKSLVDMDYIFADQYLEKYFPHVSIPHIVWLYDGKYYGSTYADALNESVINNLLATSNFQVHLKNDLLNFEPNKSIRSQLEIDINSVPKVEILFTGYLAGLNPNAGTFYKTDNYTLYRIVNFGLKYLFANAFRDMFIDVPNWAITIDKNVSSSIQQSLNDPKSYEDSFCFEVQCADELQEVDVLNYLRECLVSTFKIIPVREHKILTYWDLKVVDIERFNESVGFFVQEKNKNYISYSALKEILLRNYNLPINDLTKIKSNLYQFEVPINIDWTDEKEVYSFLNKSGLHMVKVQANIPTVTFKKV